jgi:hypothetical protein
MSRGAQTLRKGDLVKAIKGAMEAGLSVQRVEVEKGKIIVFAGQPEATREQQPNEWDGV